MTEPIEESPNTPESAPPAGRFVFRGDMGTDTAQVWLSAFLIVAAGIIGYSNGFSIPFHAEDQVVIRDNAALHSIATISNALGNDSNTLQLDRSPRAFVYFTYALNWVMTEGAAASFHAVNIFLHVLNGVLLFLLCRSLLGKSINPVIAMLAGMLFVLHPLASESVNYIVGRPALLATSLALISLNLFARATQEEESRLGAITASAVFFVLAACAADLALLVPVFILIIDWIRKGPALRNRFTIHLPYWGLLIALVAFRWAAGYGPVLSFPTADTVTRFALSSLYPTGLCVVPIEGNGFGAGVVGLVVMLGLLAAALLSVAARSMAGLGLLWFLLALAYMPGEPDAERRAYLALAGLVLIVPYLFTFLGQQPLRVGAGLVAAGLVFAAAAGTHVRNMAWQSETALWIDALDKAPASAQSAHNLGRAYLVATEAASMPEMARKAAEEAELYLRQALENAPGDPTVRDTTRIAYDLGTALSRQGKTDEAAAQFVSVLQQDIDNRSAMVELALLYSDKGANDPAYVEKAIEYFRAADAIEPLSADAASVDAAGRYGVTLFGNGDFDAAVAALTKAVGDNNASPFEPMLRQARDTSKRFGSLAQQAAQLLSKNPADPNGLKLQAQVLLTRGQTLQAGYLLDQLRQGGVNDFGVWLLTGCVRAKMKSTAQFVQEWPGAPEKPAGVKSAWLELARMCTNLGMWDAAQAYLESMPAQTEAEMPPLLAMSSLALELRQPRLAYDFLMKATTAYPNDPTPWLRLTELAASGNDTASAWKYLGEAEHRGATPEQIAAQKGRLTGGAPGQPERTVIR